MSGKYDYDAIYGGVMTPDQISLIVFVGTVAFNVIVFVSVICVALAWLKKKYNKLVKECENSKKASLITPTTN